MSLNLHETRYCCNNASKNEIVFLCQLVAAFTILIAAVLNLSLSDRDKELWATLAGAAFTYLIPNPKTHHKHRNEPIYSDPTKQLQHELSPQQYSIELHDETSRTD